MARKAAFHNLGCKVNAYEVEAMQEAMAAAGYTIVPFAPGADVYVINTCTVTNIADRKSRQMLHRARSMDPGALVVAVGCYVEVKGEELQKDPAIDLVIGTHEKGELVPRIEHFLAERKRQGAGDEAPEETISPPVAGEERRRYEPLSISHSGAHTRAFLKVEDGCDNYCSYCIIPYARGHVRSRPLADVVREAERLVDAGVPEIVLTGIHICSYGKDMQRSGNPDAAGSSGSMRDAATDLTELIEAVHAVQGLRRLRLGSLEPSFLNEGTVKAWAALPKLCPHFHLSLQSGCDTVLARMNRKYTTAMFAEKVALLREYFADPAITTDLITGFPGETEEEFEETLAFTERMGFFETHVFPYSRREGTRAAAMEGQCTEAVKKERSRRLLELHTRQQEAYLETFLEKELEVLFEEQVERDGETYALGHGARYQQVFLRTSEDLRGRFATVVPHGVEKGALLA